jgi:hypothetical protein
MTITTQTTITSDDADTQREDGFYLIGQERFRSVTAALDVWSKDALKIWSAGLAAEAAFDELPRLVQALITPDCGRTWHKACEDHDWQERCENCRCRDCMPCVTRWMRDRHIAESARRKDEGTRVHRIVKHWVLTGYWLPAETDIEAYVASFQAFVAEYGLTPEDWEMAEARVINRAYGYAGTLDCAFWIRRDRSKAAYDLLDRLTPDGAERLQEALLLGDYKTREKEDRAIFTDMPLQLAGYRFAEALVLADGRELPMLAVDATAIVQIRPDKTTLELVLAEEPEFATFLNVLAGDSWAQERGKRAIGSRTFSYPPSIVKARAADARRRKKDEAAAAPADPTVKTSNEVGPVNPTPAERGARAAAAAKQPDAGAVWSDYAHSHQAPVNPDSRRKRRDLSYDRKVVDAKVAILGGPGRPDDGEPPF